MSAPDQRPQAAADLAAAIARLATELALAEEPSGFVAALEHDPDERDAREHGD
jgi:hypothetical protein